MWPMTTITLRTGSPANTKVDVVVIGVAQKPSKSAKDASTELEVAPGGEAVAEAYGRKFVPLLRSFEFRGAANEVLRIPTNGLIKASQLVIVGLGTQADLDPEVIRRAVGVAARNVGNAASVALAMPAEEAQMMKAAVGGFLAGGYTYTAYKSKPKDSQISDLIVLSPLARNKEMIAALAETKQLNQAIMKARDWVNCPPNTLPPATFATQAQEWATTLQADSAQALVTTEVFDEADLGELGCGGILGVGQGSTQPPRLVKLTYAPDDAKAVLALVGKGITFDSGGLSIKPAGGMAAMKSDMAGAATVIAATHAIAQLGLPIKVVTFAPMAENMPSGTAIRPGDVLTMHNGKTVEISNTDAEGRLILADALSLATEEKPDLIIDVATLTGACIIALGEKIAGIFGDDSVLSRVKAAATVSGELFWPLPIPEDKRDEVTQDSRVADLLQHKFVRWGGSLYAAAFLEQFTDTTPWAHLDIAGPSFNTGGSWGQTPPGGTGFGVSTLVEVARGLATNLPTDETDPV
jgi:leucyl aminopeptidase